MLEKRYSVAAYAWDCGADEKGDHDTSCDWALAESIVEVNLEEYEEDYRENHMDA